MKYKFGEYAMCRCAKQHRTPLNSPIDQRNIDAPLEALWRRSHTLHFAIVLRQRVAVIVQHFSEIADAFVGEVHLFETVAQILLSYAAFWRAQKQLHDLQNDGKQLVEVFGYVVASLREFGERQVENLGLTIPAFDVMNGYCACKMYETIKVGRSAKRLQHDF